MIQSIVTQRGAVRFPAFMAERIYMQEFTKKEGLPFGMSRWQGTVDAMLDGIETDGPIYLMVDQKIVEPNMTHRRGGIHIDGYWNPGKQAWDTPGPNWLYAGGHGHGGGHRTQPSGHSHGHIVEPRSGHRIPVRRGPSSIRPEHRFAESEWPAEAIILASDVSACRAFHGEFDGKVGEGGSCDHIDLSRTEEIRLDAGVCYAGNVTMLHESLPLEHGGVRTVVRLNVPGWTP